MEIMHGLSEMLECLGLFGGIGLIVLANSKAKIDRMKAERQTWQQPAAASDPALLEEMKAMRRQMSEMQSTGHEFDISFDAALSRLEERISRVETKTAAPLARSSQGHSEEEPLQRNGLG